MQATQILDRYGKPYTQSNPLYVGISGSNATIGNVGIVAPLPITYEQGTLVDSGTVDVASGDQYPNTGHIAQPTHNFRNYFLLYINNSTETVADVSCVTFAVGIPSYVNGEVGIGGVAGNTTNITNGNAGSGLVGETAHTANPFIAGPAQFNFNLSTAPTSAGTIGWALYGY